MRLLQSVVLLLNLTPLRRVFRRVYALGLRRVVAALARHPAVFCIFGCGSYFEGQPTYGLSDIDLIIVLRDGVTRSDAAPGEIAGSYERVRRFFPFLGQWYEKEANLIYLSDVAAGFPAPESFRIRLKERRLVTLYGEALPSELAGGRITTSEVLAELTTLLRLSLVTDPRYARRLAFWKRVFNKTIALTELADLPQLAADTRGHAELKFLAEDDTWLFFRTAEPDRLYSLQLTIAQRMCDALRAREPETQIQFVVPGCGSRELPAPDLAPAQSSAVAELARSGYLSVTTIASAPIGLVPRLLYFPIDGRIPVLELRGGAYPGLQRLRQALLAQPATDENALVAVEGFLFVATRQPTFVDILPLDPLQFANVYAAASGEPLAFTMPTPLLAEQEAAADEVFAGFAVFYRLHEAHVTKLPYPWVYRENDVEVIEKALRILRVHIAGSPERILIQRSVDLFEYLRERHPECRDFLAELQRYRQYLFGGLSAAEVANNVYRCLHQFMRQFLSGADRITLDPMHQHLEITVGVITRNRAGDLVNLLDSLTHQRRPPDEVLVVDNGSTDRTQAVLEGFRDRLPIRRVFLAEASIPSARNLVIDEAAHDIVSFIDDDCISEPEWLAAIERGFLRADNVGMVGGWVQHEPAAQPSSVDNYYRVFHHTKP
jgi:predicted nucleotidyltransferase